MINTREIASEYRLSHWALIIQERSESGLSIKAFCRQIGICANTYFYWQRKLREAACEQLTKRESTPKFLSAPSFAEVMVCESPTSVASVEAVSQLRIEISGVQITADSTYPTDKLSALLRELMRSC